MRRIKAVLFDFDGTLTRPGSIDFAEVRRMLGCPSGQPVLEFIESLKDEGARRDAMRILDGIEMEAARKSAPNAGAEEMVLRLHAAGLGLGIVSRNSRSSILEGLKNFRAVSARHFPAIVSRENSGRPKPHPDGVLRAAGMLGIPVGQTLVVGDYVFDIAAGRAAGAVTAFLTNGAACAPKEPSAHFTIQDLGELAGVLGL